MPILNFTTKIDTWKTVTEIQQILSKHGVTNFSIRNENNFPAALIFTIEFKGQPLNFLLPCNYKGVLNAFKKDRKVPRTSQNDEQALRTAWRIIKDWVEAQCALIESEQAKPEVIFLPYLMKDDGQTLSQYLLEGNGLKLLNNG